MKLMTIMNYQALREQKKNSNKYKEQLNKMKDEVGMAVPKNTQTRFVQITYVSHPLYFPSLLFSIINIIHI